MSERTRKIRDMLARRPFLDEQDTIILMLLDEVEALNNALDDIRSTNDNHHQRLTKEINKLKGVHGA